jgi:molybdenum cofactor synthesis domain-containing protein
MSSASRIDETREFIAVRIAVLTVSDTRTSDDDRSGDTLVARLEAAGHQLAARSIVKDDRTEIANILRAWCDDEAVDVIISTGGTGLTGRDVTVEAHRDVYEKEIDAFGTVFHPREHGEDRHQRGAISGDWRRCERDVFVRTSGQHWRVQRRVGRDFGQATRLPPPSV